MRSRPLIADGESSPTPPDADRSGEESKRRKRFAPHHYFAMLFALSILMMVAFILAAVTSARSDRAAQVIMMANEEEAILPAAVSHAAAATSEEKAAQERVLADAFNSPLRAAEGWRPTNVIPRVLHQTWPNRRVPEALHTYIRSWRRLQPDWAYVLHTDADNAALVAEPQYAWLQPLYERMSPIQQADLARVLYMHKVGGVYADLDVELLQPLLPLLHLIIQRKGARAILGQEPLAHAVLLERRPRQACNALLASEAGHPFWLWLAQRIGREMTRGGLDGVTTEDPVGTTGPRMLNEALLEWQAVHAKHSAASVYVAPPDTFFPLWDGMQKDKFAELCAETAAYQDDAEIVQLSLSAAVVATCRRLRDERFEPTVSTKAAFTAHHWVHTWLAADSFPDGAHALASDTNETVAATAAATAAASTTTWAFSTADHLSADTVRALGRLDAELQAGGEGPGRGWGKVLWRSMIS